MQSQKDRPQMGMHWLRRHWIVFMVVAAACALLLAGQPLLAAGAPPAINQTVPPPTPAPSVPTPGAEKEDKDKSDNNAPGSSESQPAAPTEVAVDAAPLVDSLSLFTAVVNTSAINVRQGPGLNFPVVGGLSQGDIVTVEARNAAGDWWLICCVPATQTRGWVSAALVAPNFSAEQAALLPLANAMADVMADAAPPVTPEPTTEVVAETVAAETGEATVETPAEVTVEAMMEPTAEVPAEVTAEAMMEPATEASPEMLPSTGGEQGNWPLVGAGFFVAALVAIELMRQLVLRKNV